MSELPAVESKEDALCIRLEDARIAVDLTLRELAKRVDEREAIKAELAAIRYHHEPSEPSSHEFVVPWGFCEDDD